MHIPHDRRYENLGMLHFWQQKAKTDLKRHLFAFLQLSDQL